MDGPELITRLRAQRLELPAILMSDKELSTALPDVQFLDKPFNVEQLLAAVVAIA